MIKKSLLLIITTGILNGCVSGADSRISGGQLMDWPTCSAIGGVLGAGAGAIKSATYAGWGSLLGAGAGAVYCGVYGDDDDSRMVNEKHIEYVPSVSVINSRPVSRGPVIISQPIPVIADTIARIELDVKFDFDKANIKPEGFRDVKLLADFMKSSTQTIVTLEGHTDSKGSAEYNEALSQKRVEAVRKALIDMGIRPERLKAVGYGKIKPIATNDTDAGRATNRRVEAVIESLGRSTRNSFQYPSNQQQNRQPKR